MNETVKEVIVALGIIGVIALGGCTKAGETTTSEQMPAPFLEVETEDAAPAGSAPAPAQTCSTAWPFLRLRLRHRNTRCRHIQADGISGLGF